jgi:hypothetical protein
VLNKRSSKSRRRSAAGRRPRNCPALEQLEDRIQPSEITVTGSGDGPGVLKQFPSGTFTDTTLRGAINAANVDPDSSVVIDFDPQVFDFGTKTTISLLSSPPPLPPLPPLTITRNNVTIMAIETGTEPNAQLQGITVDGSSAGASATGLVITGSDCQIKGINFQNFAGSGIDISGPGAQRNHIFTPLITDNGTGVLIEGGATDNIIGDPQDRPDGGDPGTYHNHIIAGNYTNIEIDGAGTAGNVVEGNHIGGIPNGFGFGSDHYGVILSNGAFGNIIGGQVTNQDDLPYGNIISVNNQVGVLMFGGADDNIIGGTTNGGGNLIEGNRFTGVYMLASNDNFLEGNVIGTGGINGDNYIGVIMGGGSSGNEAVSNVIVGNQFAGIQMDTEATDNLIQDNLIGSSNTILYRGNGTGVLIEGGATDNTVGPIVDQVSGGIDGFGNTIVGNTGPGIAIEGDGTSGNKVQGNRIGIGDNGPLPNDTGVVISAGASENMIGGTVMVGGIVGGPANVISANSHDGIDIQDSGTSGNVVQGNIIGQSLAGNHLSNGGTGVVIRAGASENMIGGTAAGAGNVISANSHDGIDIQGSETVENVVQGNIIGADSSGQNPLPNGGDGVRIDTGASENTIGGGAGTGNIIAFNTGAGVDVRDSSSIRNAIQLNSIFNNQALGIDLGGDGVTQNMTGGPGTGPNDLQNFPTIHSVTSGTVTFTLDSSTNININLYRIDFYANTMRDPSGFGQGGTYLGSMDVSAGNVSYTFHYTPVPGQPWVTATATDFVGNTSEFSAAMAPHNLQSDSGHLRIQLDNQQNFRLVRDPLFPQLLDLGFDKDTVSIDPSVFSQIDVTGAADSTIDIEDVPAGLPVTINGVTGNQIVNISPSAQNLGHIQSPIIVQGGKSSLTLNIYDQSDPLADVYTLTDSGLSDKQSAGISYNGVSAVNLIGSSLPDTYNILNTARSATTALYSNNGGDVVNVEATTGPLTVNLPASGNPTVHVSPTAQSLSTIQGSLTVAGQGVGTLVLNDQGGTAGRNYTLTSTNLGWGGPASIAFGELGALTLDATTFNDTVLVQSLPAFPVTLDGGKGNNTLVGPDTDNTWMLAPPSGAEGTLNNSLVFNSFASVSGGQAKDRFVVPDGAYIPEFLSGGDGASGGSNNTLDLSAWTSPLTVHIGGSVYGGTVPGAVRAFALCQNVIGGQSDDRFLFDQGSGLTTVDGGPGNNTLDFSPYFFGSLTFGILGHNSGLIGGIIGAFSNVQNLIGGQTNDRFAFRGTAYLDGIIDGQGGTNLLSYTQSAASVSVNLQTGAASYVNLQGGSSPQPGGIANIQSFVGGPGSANTLIAADISNNWSITGPNSGTVNGFTFQGFQNLTGGAAVDAFAFQQGGSVSGSVDGGGGENSLDYSQYTGDITVDLALNLASLVNQGMAGSVWHIANVAGSIGNNLLVGDANANVLTGGTGRNILIGGKGSDTLDASRSTSDNLLIGGWTDYDTWLAALDAIFAEWTRTDLGFRDRFSDLLTGSNSTGSPALNVVRGQLILLTAATNPKSNNGTVHADTSPDTLIGSKQIDPSTGQRAHNLFFSDADDILVNFLNSSDQKRKVT